MKLADLPVKEVRKLGLRDPVRAEDDERETESPEEGESALVVVDSEFVIEKGVPLPRRGRQCKYPFERMEVGDSFVRNYENERAARLGQKNMTATACVWAGRFNPARKFETRVIGCQVRIWRVK